MKILKIIKQKNKILVLCSFLFFLLITHCKGDDRVLVSCNASPRYITNDKILFVALIDITYKLFIFDKSDNTVKYFAEQLEETYEIGYSPKIKQIAFVQINYKDKNSNIFLMDTEAKNIKQVTFKDLYHNYPFFSNDGKKLYFTRKEKDNFKMYFYCIDLANYEEKKICNTPFFVDCIPACSNDDKYIIFSEGRHYQRILKLNTTNGLYDILKDNGTILATTMMHKEKIIFAESNYRYGKMKAGDKITKAIYLMDLNILSIDKLFDANWDCSYIQVSPNDNEIMYMNSLNKLVISNFTGTNKRIIDLEKMIEEQLIKE